MQQNDVEELIDEPVEDEPLDPVEVAEEEAFEAPMNESADQQSAMSKSTKSKRTDGKEMPSRTGTLSRGRKNGVKSQNELGANKIKSNIKIVDKGDEASNYHGRANYGTPKQRDLSRRDPSRRTTAMGKSAQSHDNHYGAASAHGAVRNNDRLRRNQERSFKVNNLMQ